MHGSMSQDAPCMLKMTRQIVLSVSGLEKHSVQVPRPLWGPNVSRCQLWSKRYRILFWQLKIRLRVEYRHIKFDCYITNVYEIPYTDTNTSMCVWWVYAYSFPQGFYRWYENKNLHFKPFVSPHRETAFLVGSLSPM